MQSPIISMKCKSRIKRIRIYLAGSILIGATIVAALPGFMLKDHLVYAEQKQVSSRMAALAQDARHLGKYVPREVLVKFKDEASSLGMKSLDVDGNTHEIKAFSVNGRVIHQYKLDGTMSVDEAVLKYRSNPAIEYAEPNYLYWLKTIPNDAQFDTLWGLHNTGQTVNGIGERQMPTSMLQKPGTSAREAPKWLLL